MEVREVARCIVLKNRESFTKDTGYITVPVRNIKEINVSLDFLQNGTTAPTLANVLSVINELQAIVKGNVVHTIKAVDLYALNVLLFGYRPIHVLPANDNEAGSLQGLVWPFNFPVLDKIQVTYSGHNTVDTEKLTLSVDYGGRLGAPIFLRYIQDTSQTGAFKAYDISWGGMKLIALLLYATSVPDTTSSDGAIDEVKVKVDDQEVYHNLWLAINDFKYIESGSTIEGILDNYKLIDFRDTPLPANNLKVELKGSAAETFRAVGVYTL